MPFLTLNFNNGTIMGIINIFCTLTTQLDLNKEIGYNEVIMIRGNLFINKNMIQTIF